MITAKHLAIAAALLAGGCAPDITRADIAPAYDELWADYDTEYGFAEPECEHFRPITYIVQQDQFPDFCGSRPFMRGCTAVDPDNDLITVWVHDSDSDPRYLIKHEGLHALLLCEGAVVTTIEANADHSDEVWDVLDVR